MNKKVIIIAACMLILFLVVSVVSGIWYLHDGKLHVIFCNVGQGDGIMMKTPQGKILLLDGGPDESFQRCLAAHVPFWYRTVDLMMVSHPHSDHFLGDMGVLQSFKVKAFATENLSSDQKAYQLLMSLLSDKKVKQQVLTIGDTYSIGNVVIRVLGPSRELLSRSSPNGQIGESKEFASLLLLLQFGNTTLLLPGDSQAAEMHEAVEAFGIRQVSILQAPHHGSATGLDTSLLSVLSPRLGVISVGAHNRYGHPAASTLGLFQAQNVQVLRTDKTGDIEVITDGRTLRVKE